MFPIDAFRSTVEKAAQIFQSATPADQDQIHELAGPLQLGELLQEVLRESDDIR